MLLGKLIIRGKIKALTGLRIGGTTGGLKIGGVDLNVITDAKGVPYIPGSSLKGKLRSLIEWKEGVDFDPRSGLHTCKENPCDICKIWGTLGEVESLTRLIVRDIPLNQEKFKEIKEKEYLPLDWTEVKTEINIDRNRGTVSSQGGLRQVERVPAGAIFSPLEIIYNVYEEGDKDILIKLFEAMELLEQDYLGGMGSRGYGKVKFQDLKIYWNKKEDYERGEIDPDEKEPLGVYESPAEVVRKFGELKGKIS